MMRILTIAALVALVIPVISENPSRKLTPNGWEFEPVLSFTEDGFSTQQITLSATENPWLSISNPTCAQSPLASLCTFSIRAGEASQFTVHGLAGPKQWKCQGGADLLVWIRSTDGNVIFAPPALPSSSASKSGDLVVNFVVPDPGAYDVTVVVADKNSKGNRVLPVRGGGWRLWVHPPNARGGTEAAGKGRGGGAAAAGAELSKPPAHEISLPAATCKAPDESNGRWVRCVAAAIPRDQCLRDGWVFVPVNCRYAVLGSGALLLQEAKKHRPDPLKPLWVVVIGSSIERGTLHTMVDLVTGVRGHLSDRQLGAGQGRGKDRTAEVVRDALFGTPTSWGSPRRKGAVEGCWGWTDVQVGSLRLSYMDFRPVYNSSPNYGPQAMKRLSELLEEGPDLVVSNLNAGSAYQALSKAGAAFTGTLVVAPTKTHFLGGGIKAVYCSRTQSNAQRLKLSLHSFSEKCGAKCKAPQPPSWAPALSPPSSTQGLDLGPSSRLVCGDELLMAWAFVFDTERSMGDPSSSQHFQGYAFSNYDVKQEHIAGACSDGNGREQQQEQQQRFVDGREILGTVNEMAAHMYLSLAMAVARRTPTRGPTIGDSFDGQGNSSASASADMCEPPGDTTRDEGGYSSSSSGRLPQKAPLVADVLVCFDCPPKPCCPWVPPQSSPFSITSIHNRTRHSASRGPAGTQALPPDFPLAPDLADVGPRGCFARSAFSPSTSLSSSSSSVLATATKNFLLPPLPPARRPKPTFVLSSAEKRAHRGGGGGPLGGPLGNKNGGKGEVAGGGDDASAIAATDAAATVVSPADNARASTSASSAAAAAAAFSSSDAPVLNHAQPCWDSCGGKAGSCPQHCGQRGACCKLGHVAEKGHEAGGSRHGAGLGFVIPRPHVQHRGDLQCHHGKLGCKEEFCCVQKPDFV